MVKGEPWWYAVDVCKILGIGNSRQAISCLDDDERNTVTSNDGIRGNPNFTVVNESGLYSLIFKSRKPEAKRFKKWVTSEVLPTIRKTGTYQMSRIAKTAKRSRGPWPHPWQWSGNGRNKPPDSIGTAVQSDPRRPAEQEQDGTILIASRRNFACISDPCRRFSLGGGASPGLWPPDLSTLTTGETKCVASPCFSPSSPHWLAS
jgi:hypothetical protein